LTYEIVIYVKAKIMNVIISGIYPYYKKKHCNWFCSWNGNVQILFCK